MWTLYFAPFENMQVPAPCIGELIWYSQLRNAPLGP
jgi:hypothetical protein